MVLLKSQVGSKIKNLTENFIAEANLKAIVDSEFIAY